MQPTTPIVGSVRNADLLPRIPAPRVPAIDLTIEAAPPLANVRFNPSLVPAPHGRVQLLDISGCAHLRRGMPGWSSLRRTVSILRFAARCRRVGLTLESTTLRFAVVTRGPLSYTDIVSLGNGWRAGS